MITIDWDAKIIEVPKTYTQFVQNDPVSGREIRSLDTDVFRLDLSVRGQHYRNGLCEDPQPQHYCDGRWCNTSKGGNHRKRLPSRVRGWAVCG